MSGEEPTTAFGLLGSVAAWDRERNLRLGGSRRRTVLAALMLEVGRPVQTEQLIDAVWNDAPPATARKALQVHVLELRRSFAGTAGFDLRTVDCGYELKVESDRIDLHRFRGLVARARNSPPELAAGLLREALELRRGPALADLAGRAWADRVARSIEEEVLTAIEWRIGADLELGRGAELVAELTALAAEHPLRELLRGQLMLALHRSGRTAEALREFRLLREQLVEEVGIEPGARMQRLHQGILNGDPDLIGGSG